MLAHHHLRGVRPFSDSVWADFIRRSGATDITPSLRAMKGSDPVGYDGGHWSAAGHRLVASIVKERLEAADFAPNLAIVSPNTIWYVQVGALVVGHVAGLAIAHDRAVALFSDRRDALRSQYPLLALMVLYTVGGLWLLSRG